MGERERTGEGKPEENHGYLAVGPGGALEAYLDGVAVVDGKGRFLRANHRFRAIVGFEERELLDRTVYDLMDEKSASEARKEGDRLRRGEGISGEVVFRRKSGVPVPVAFSILPLVDSTGELLSVVITISDRSRYRKLEREKREKEARFRTLADHANDGIVISLADGKHVYANPRMAEISGYSIEELLHVNMVDLAHPEERERLQENNERRMRGETVERSYQTAIRHKTGRKIPVEITPSLTEWEGEKANLVIVRDVTARFRTERVIREERDRAQRYLDAAEVILVVLDRRAAVRLINRKGCRVLGWREDDLLGRDWMETCLPERTREPVREIFHKLMGGEIAPGGRFENEVITRTGEERLISWTNTILTDEKGRPNGILSCGEDVTERRKAERALRESEERYRLLVDRSPVPILIHGEKRVIFLNRAAAAALGGAEEEILGRRIEEVFPPGVEDGQEARSTRPDGDEDTPRAVRRRVRRPDGGTFVVEVVATAVRFQGRPASQVVFWDVSERVHAEELRREEARRTKILGRFTTIGNRAVDLDALLREALDAAIEMLRFDMGAVFLIDETKRTASVEMMRGMVDSVPESMRTVPIDEEPFRRVFVEGVSIMDTESSKDTARPIQPAGLRTGVSLPLIMNEKIVGSLNFGGREERRLSPRDRELLRAMARELGAAYSRLRAQEALRESEMRFRTIFDKAPMAIYLENMNGDVLDANAEAERMTGYEREELIGMNARDLVTPEMAAHIPEIIRKTVEDGGFEAEVVNLNREGKAVPTRLQSTVIRLGGRTFFFVMGRDITEETRARTILEENERRFRALYENAPLAYQSIDPAGRVIGVNRAWLDLLGYDGEKVIGAPFRDLVAPEARRRFDGWFRELFSAGAVDVEFPVLREGGKTLEISFHGRTGVDAQNRIDRAHCILADVSEWKRREDQLELLAGERARRIGELERRQRAVDRLAATARMAAGIAHEINNPLAAIKNSISLIRDAVPPEHPNLEYVDIVQNEIGRLAEIVRMMYTIYKPSESTIRTVPVAPLVEEVARLAAKGEGGRKAKVETSVEPPDLTVRLGEGALRTALFNVIRNALEASPDGSPVNVRVRRESRARFLIEVEDRGEGIPDRIADRIFEPFFTTKTSGPTSGMGLGLSLTRSLVESIGGTIEFVAGEGGGTVFRIRLPVEDRGRN